MVAVAPESMVPEPSKRVTSPTWTQQLQPRRPDLSSAGSRLNLKTGNVAVFMLTMVSRWMPSMLAPLEPMVRSVSVLSPAARKMAWFGVRL